MLAVKKFFLSCRSNPFKTSDVLPKVATNPLNATLARTYLDSRVASAAVAYPNAAFTMQVKTFGSGPLAWYHIPCALLEKYHVYDVKKILTDALGTHI